MSILALDDSLESLTNLYTTLDYMSEGNPISDTARRLIGEVEPIIIAYDDDFKSWKSYTGTEFKTLDNVKDKDVLAIDIMYVEMVDDKAALVHHNKANSSTSLSVMAPVLRYSSKDNTITNLINGSSVPSSNPHDMLSGFDISLNNSKFIVMDPVSLEDDEDIDVEDLEDPENTDIPEMEEITESVTHDNYVNIITIPLTKAIDHIRHFYALYGTNGTTAKRAIESSEYMLDRFDKIYNIRALDSEVTDNPISSDTLYSKYDHIIVTSRWKFNPEIGYSMSADSSSLGEDDVIFDVPMVILSYSDDINGQVGVIATDLYDHTFDAEETDDYLDTTDIKLLLLK